MKLKIEIKNRFTGKIIFEYEKENNSISETVKEFISIEIKSGKRFADLRSADLRSADLISANLRFANLSYANLSYTNLSSADLRSADLSSANLDKKYISVTRIGSANRMTTYCFDDDIIWCGCFKGSLAEFEDKVKVTHKDNKIYLSQYLGFIDYVKSLKKIYS